MTRWGTYGNPPAISGVIDGNYEKFSVHVDYLRTAPPENMYEITVLVVTDMAKAFLFLCL
jgi:hypothetical protein